MRKLRLGIVGCGAVVTLHHLPALRQTSRVDLVALADRDRSWGTKVARKFGVRQFHEDYREMIGHVDAVLVATPNTTHADIACSLLEVGVHVLCEKPMATTSADVERMYQASAKGGGRLVASHNSRFNANVAMLKTVIARGWLGAVEEISGGLGSAYEAAERRTDFRRERRLSGGGVLIDLGIHLIDVAVWLAGERPISVRYDAAVAPGWDVETDADVGIEFANGIWAHFSVSFTHALDPTLKVRGTEGWASASLYDPGHLTLFTERARICQRAGAQHLILDDRPGYERGMEHFADAVLSGREFIVQPDEVAAGLAIIEQCYSAHGQDDDARDWQPEPLRSSRL